MSGIYNEPIQSYLLADENKSLLNVERENDALIISVPLKASDNFNNIVVLHVKGKLDVNNPPIIKVDANIFIDKLEVELKSD